MSKERDLEKRVEVVEEQLHSGTETMQEVKRLVKSLDERLKSETTTTRWLFAGIGTFQLATIGFIINLSLIVGANSGLEGRISSIESDLPFTYTTSASATLAYQENSEWYSRFTLLQSGTPWTAMTFIVPLDSQDDFAAREMVEEICREGVGSRTFESLATLSEELDNPVPRPSNVDFGCATNASPGFMADFVKRSSSNFLVSPEISVQSVKFGSWSEIAHEVQERSPK